ncbi:MAG TPA: DUF488 domain-containing protein [Pseudobdellovibrionaceae bacterium]|nr:DUF488 domain-containing protein [Pseudobdellovibrionaceae bacterium]
MLRDLGFEIDEFVSFLARKKIRRLIDVRKNPVSRKKGFSKNKLAEALSGKKIEYIHVPGLGVPKEWRKRAEKHEITRQEMFLDYRKKVLPAAREELALVQKLLEEKNSVLLCYEADAADCHRRFAVEALRKRMKGDLEVVDLKKPARIPSLGLRKRSGSGLVRSGTKA